METGLSNKKPGGNIDSWCGKCKLVLAHTIEAMVGDKPARVTCNTCRAQHSYKPKPPQPKSPSAPKAPGAGGRGSKSPRALANRYQALVNAKDTSATKNYSPSGRYEQGDVLEHPTFGRGAVTAVRDGTKIEVLFDRGAKILVHAG